MTIPKAPTRRTQLACLATLCAALALALMATPARAQRALFSDHAVRAVDVPDDQINGACGIAVANQRIYVSDYYNQAIEVFTASGSYKSRISGGPFNSFCQLAASEDGALYANNWHGSVVRLLPSPLTIDPEESTGVAVDPASGDVYVNHRTYVGVYEPTGSPVLIGGNPLHIGSGSLGDAYGLAAFGGRVYVPDAADDTVKVYEPAVDPLDPIDVIDGADTPRRSFESLRDGAVVVDPANGHLLVLDNLQPGFEHPEGAIDEFNSSGDFLDQVDTRVVDGEPSGLAFNEGTLLVTSGNEEESNVFSFGPYAPAASPSAVSSLGSFAATEAAAPVDSDASREHATPRSRRRAGIPTASTSEVVQRGGLRVSFDGRLTPKRLPRGHDAPVRVAVAVRIASNEGGVPPQLRWIAIAINRFGHVLRAGLPVCGLRQIQPSTTVDALEACRGSLVGEGSFSAKVRLGQQAPFPAFGRVLAFNGSFHGRPAILAHIYGTQPAPTSFTLPFVIGSAKGAFGTVLRAELPTTTGSYVTGISLNLGRNFGFDGKRRSYLNASCPAPKGLPGAVFPFAKASFGFAGKVLESTLTRSCRAGR